MVWEKFCVAGCAFFRHGILPLLLAVGIPAGAQVAEEVPMKLRSPDGRFEFRELQAGSGYVVVERKSGKILPLGQFEDGITVVGEGVPTTLWGGDSRHLAVTYRAGGRYVTTELFAWTGKKFERMPSVEEVLQPLVEKERMEFLKKENLPEDMYLRRIWDTFRTESWRDARTVDVFVHSVRSFMRGKDDGDPEDLEVSGVFTLRFDEAGNPQVITRRGATEKELNPD